MTQDSIQVGIVMGSKSDLPIMKKAAIALKDFGISSELRVLSAHRTPEAAIEYAKSARDRGIQVLIAGAGGAAHLPGVVGGLTTLPVIGVPIKSSNSIDGWDSLLSILQMPSGVPVATVAVDGAKNAGILAAQIIGVSNETVKNNLIAFKSKMREDVLAMDKNLDRSLTE